MHHSHQQKFAKALYGPWLVALAAFLWAADAIFRGQLVSQFSPLEIVFVSHCICLPFALILLYLGRKSFVLLDSKSWWALIFLSIGGSIVALSLFTQAFALSTNYTVPILIQKLQPIFAISMASILLKEKLTKSFWIYSAIAMIGAYLVSFGFKSMFDAQYHQELPSIFFAMGAAVIWGACTVAGRSVSVKLPFTLVTGLRYFLAFIFLVVIYIFMLKDSLQTDSVIRDLPIFVLMALGPGFGALMLYYYGLSSTKASVATIAELAFPVGATVTNWLYLNQALTPAQIIGAVFLVISITLLSLDNFKSSRKSRNSQ